MTYSEDYYEGNDAAVQTITDKLTAVALTGHHVGTFAHGGLERLARMIADLHRRANEADSATTRPTPHGCDLDSNREAV
jgi:hypothetical protein